jgi:hypothetical protein
LGWGLRWLRLRRGSLMGSLSFVKITVTTKKQQFQKWAYFHFKKLLSRPTINQSSLKNYITFVRYRFIYFSHFCLMLNKQNIGLPFAIITTGSLYVSYKHKLRHKHLLKSIHKFSTSYPMNNIPFLEIKLYVKIKFLYLWI